MSTTTEAIMSGLRRGFEMGTYPDATRLRELSEEAISTDFTSDAWISVGVTFRQIMSAQQDRISDHGRHKASW